MLQTKINIIIFSHNSALEAAAQDVQPPESFDIQVRLFDDFSESACRDADILVYDLPDPLPAKKLRPLCKERALLFLTLSPGGLAELDDTALSDADDYWEKPLNPKLFTFRLTKFLQWIQTRREFYLNHTYLDTLINSIPDLVWFKDLSGSHLKVNEAFCRMVGKTMDDVIGQGHCYIWNVDPDDPESGELICKQSEDTVVQEQRTCQFTEKVKSSHGMRQFKTYKSPYYDEDGTILGTVGIGHDITDLENLGTELEIFLQSMPFAILLCNEEGVIINSNQQAEEYFGSERKQLLGQPYMAWAEQTFDQPKSVNSEGFVEAAVRGSSPLRILEIHEAPIHDVFQNIVGRVCIYRDVTTERKLEKQILHNSNTDFLTGLYNRRCFYHYIRNNRGGRPISLLYADLDNFKRINDTYGHKVGDQALVMAAGILRECFANEFIARIGGDEFLIASLDPCSLTDLEARAQHLIDRMIQSFKNTSPLSELSVSIGIAKTEDPAKDIDQLIQESDTALYEAKQMGKARYSVFDRDFRRQHSPRTDFAKDEL